MTDRLGEQGAIQYAQNNPTSAGVSRLGGAGALQAAIADALSNGLSSLNGSRLGGKGRIYALASGAGPMFLFNNSEKGIWYDPSDFSTLFQDNAGTTPVTAVGQAVGKILDKSGNGYHATQATGPARPILGRHPITGRRNLLDATDTLATQSYTTKAVAYTLSFTGTGTVTLSGAYVGSLVGTGASNRVSLTFTSTAASLTLTVSGSVTFAQLETGTSATAYQKVVSTYDVTEAGVNDAYYLKFDGVDDFMVTPSIGFSGTDKISVFAGVRKLSDGATGVFIESSVSIGTNTGVIQIAAPITTSASYTFQSKGTAQSTATYTNANVAAPTTNVLSGIADIANDVCILRLNSAQVASSVQDQGTGAYGNYPLYIGMRAGTSIAFNGHLYSLIVRGALSDANQISAAESFVNLRTGAY